MLEKGYLACAELMYYSRQKAERKGALQILKSPCTFLSSADGALGCFLRGVLTVWLLLLLSWRRLRSGSSALPMLLPLPWTSDALSNTTLAGRTLAARAVSSVATFYLCLSGLF